MSIPEAVSALQDFLPRLSSEELRSMGVTYLPVVWAPDGVHPQLGGDAFLLEYSSAQHHLHPINSWPTAKGGSEGNFANEPMFVATLMLSRFVKHDTAYGKAANKKCQDVTPLIVAAFYSAGMVALDDILVAMQFDEFDGTPFSWILSKVPPVVVGKGEGAVRAPTDLGIPVVQIRVNPGQVRDRVCIYCCSAPGGLSPFYAAHLSTARSVPGRPRRRLAGDSLLLLRCLAILSLQFGNLASKPHSKLALAKILVESRVLGGVDAPVLPSSIEYPADARTTVAQYFAAFLPLRARFLPYYSARTSGGGAAEARVGGGGGASALRGGGVGGAAAARGG